MTEQSDTEVWVEVEGSTEGADEESNASTWPTNQTSPLEAQAVRLLADHDIGLSKVHPISLEFAPHPRLDVRGTYSTRLPRGYVEGLIRQLEFGARHSNRWAGIVIPDQGYCEVLIQRSLPGPSHFIIRRFKQLISNEVNVDCRHTGENCFPSLSFAEGSRDSADVRLHLVDGRRCIEVSGPSPACHVLSNQGFREVPRHLLSFKLDLGRKVSADALEIEAATILNSFIYELDVRNGIPLRPVRWPPKIDSRRLVKRNPPNQVARFPEIYIESEVAVLFGFAGSAIDNPPLAFLSYYQVLENFFPVAARRSALKKLELELSDPLFDRHADKSLMRLLAVGESSANASESGHLRALVSNFTRNDKLHEFFIGNEWGKYFTKTGPIKGLGENINPDNRNLPLAHQVADRIYKIRNRIVHAKDDPKYEAVPALLPQSDEAEALWPDIELVRFLSAEVILSTQLRG